MSIQGLFKGSNLWLKELSCWSQKVPDCVSLSFQVSPSSGSSDDGQPHGMATAGYTPPLAALPLTKPYFSVTYLQVKLEQTSRYVYWVGRKPGNKIIFNSFAGRTKSRNITGQKVGGKKKKKIHTPKKTRVLVTSCGIIY